MGINLSDTIVYLYGKPGSGKGEFVRTVKNKSAENGINVRSFSSGEAMRDILLHDKAAIQKVTEGGRVGVKHITEKYKEILRQHIKDLREGKPSLLIVDGLIRNGSSMEKTAALMDEMKDELEGLGFESGIQCVEESQHCLVDIDTVDAETNMVSRSLGELRQTRQTLAESGDLKAELEKSLGNIEEMVIDGSKDAQVKAEIVKINKLIGKESESSSVAFVAIAEIAAEGNAVTRVDDWLHEERLDRISRFEEETLDLLTSRLGYKVENGLLSSTKEGSLIINNGEGRGVGLDDLRRESEKILVGISTRVYPEGGVFTKEERVVNIRGVET